MTIATALFSFQGRLDRANFWILSLAATAIMVAIAWVFANPLTSNVSFIIFFLLCGVPYAWIMYALAAKRLHDRDQTAWILLGTFIPYLSILFMLWLLVQAFLRGTDGDNKYGRDPATDPSARLALPDIATRLKHAIEHLGSEAPPQEEELADGRKVIVKEVRVEHHSSSGIFGLLGVVLVVGFVLATEWATFHQRHLATPGDYVDAAVAAIHDKPFLDDLDQRCLEAKSKDKCWR